MSVWRKLWIAWSAGGFGSLAALLVAQEVGVGITAAHWWLWAAIWLTSFAVLEIIGLVRRARDDTFSEQIWAMREARSIVLFACAWGIVALVTGNVWPSFPAFVLSWCLWHFWREGPYARRRYG